MYFGKNGAPMYSKQDLQKAKAERAYWSARKIYWTDKLEKKTFCSRKIAEASLRCAIDMVAKLDEEIQHIGQSIYCNQ